MSVDADLLILGAGIAGASAAAFMAGRRRLILLEREAMPGCHATGRSAAMYLASYGGPAVRPLAAASHAFLANPPDGFGGTLLAPRAALHVAGEGQAQSLAAMAAAIPGLEALDGAEARRLVPILRAETVDAALYEPSAADIDVHRLHMGFLRLMRQGGGRLVTSVDEPAIARRGPVWEVNAGGRVLRARVLVNAAGAWADEVAVSAGVATRGLRPLRRTVVLTDAPLLKGFDAWPVIKDVDERYYFRPFAGQLLVTPCDTEPAPPCDAQPDEAAIALAMERLTAACEHAPRLVRHAWAGLRTFAADQAPVVGWAPDTEGFFWLAGLGGFGIQTAPAIGRLAAALLEGQPAPDDLRAHGIAAASYAPGRPALRAAA